MKKIRTFTELSKMKSFEERFEYLKLNGLVGDVTFGNDRWLNQNLYTSKRWRQARDIVLIRDDGNDLGYDGYEIPSRVIVHHMNPITQEDIELDRDIVYDPEFLISTSHDTHNAIHYGDKRLLQQPYVARTRNDTCPWK